MLGSMPPQKCPIVWRFPGAVRLLGQTSRASAVVIAPRLAGVDTKRFEHDQSHNRDRQIDLDACRKGTVGVFWAGLPRLRCLNGEF